MEATVLREVFDGLFSPVQAVAEDRARLVAGGDEPQYLPASATDPVAQVIYARGLVESGLHEMSHWLNAGRVRRRLTDFGYWYVPDGRDDAQQQVFEQVEVRTQGLEWLLARAAGLRFRLSADNLRSPVPSPAFAAAVLARARALAVALHRPADADPTAAAPRLSRRARRVVTALAGRAGRPLPTALDFVAAEAW